MVLQFVPLGEAAGVEVRGIDPREPVTGPDLETLLSAWRDNLVLLIRGTALSDEELIAFARVFGALEPPGPNPYGAPFLPDFPELNVISNVVKDGQPIGGLGAGEAVWHADMTYRERPSKAAVLHAIEVPESGGDTYFANMITAYETLPSGLKQRIEGRAAIHDAAHNSAGQLRKGYHETTDISQTPGAQHPLVRTDPDTGRKGIWFASLSNELHISLRDDLTGFGPTEMPLSPGLRPGRLGRHIAFAMDGTLDEIGAHLDAEGIPYELGTAGLPQIFCEDPAGNFVEFNTGWDKELV